MNLQSNNTTLEMVGPPARLDKCGPKPPSSPVCFDPDRDVHDLCDFENIPAELRTLPQWVCWKLEPDKNGRLTKIPYTATGRRADTTDPQTWATFESCRDALRSNKFFGLGFAFADGGELTGIDLDNHRDPATGELDAFAAKYVSKLNSYTEESQSGTGVHTIARATIPGNKGRRDAKAGVEMYSKARFFVMTGKHLTGTPHMIEPRQQAVTEMYREVFAPKEKPQVNKPAPFHVLTLTDQELINKARQSKNGVKFSALMLGDFAAAGYGSQSEADAALLAMLYFWTGGDKDRSYSLFAQSGLNRDKWEREDYRERTWQRVAQGEVYSLQSRTSVTQPPQAAPLKSVDSSIASSSNQAHDFGEYVGGEIEPEQNTPQPPAMKRLSELKRFTENDPDELLKNRYLCRGGGALWVAQTGIGKSSAELQAAILWAVGKPFFGIKPARPLKSLIIQAENDDGDLAEFKDGIYAGLNLTPEEIELADSNIRIVTEDSRTGRQLCKETIEPHLANFRPDILWLDPASSYLGGNVSAQEIVTPFLRNLLNPLIRKHGCAIIIVHHTNKPPKEKLEWVGADLAYLFAGAAEWGNWARAVLVIHSTKAEDVFKLIASKRGARIGWKDENGATIKTRLIAHSREPGLIYWRDPDAAEIEQSSRLTAEKTVENLIALVPTDKPIEKNELLKQKAPAVEMGINKARTLLKIAVKNEKLFEWKKKRSRTNDKILVARYPQPTEVT